MTPAMRWYKFSAPVNTLFLTQQAMGRTSVDQQVGHAVKSIANAQKEDFAGLIGSRAGLIAGHGEWDGVHYSI